MRKNNNESRRNEIICNPPTATCRNQSRSLLTSQHLFPCQIQRRADGWRNQTCGCHSSLTSQEVEGRTCIWLQHSRDANEKQKCESAAQLVLSHCWSDSQKVFLSLLKSVMLEEHLYFPTKTLGILYRVLHLHSDAFPLQ